MSMGIGKYKKAIAIAISLGAVLILTLFLFIGNHFNNAPRLEITFEQAGPLQRLSGYNVAVNINGRQYLFVSDTYEINRTFIQNAERLIIELENLVDFRHNPPLSISLPRNSSYYHVERDFVSISNNKETFGWLVNSWGRGNIPVWLSAGIETVARVEAGLLVSPQFTAVQYPFGDLLFTPKTWGSSLHTHAISVSYHFVRYLLYTNQLQELVSLYESEISRALRNEAWADHTMYETSLADQMAIQLFERFTSDMHMCTIFSLELIFTQVMAYAIIANTPSANNTFFFNCFQEYLNLTPSNLIHYINLIDSSIQFVYDWFVTYLPYADIHYISSEPINVDLFLSSGGFEAGGIALNQNRMQIFQLNNFSNSLCYYLQNVVAHEAVHNMVWRTANNVRLFCPFEEGLASAIATKFTMQHTSDRCDNCVDLWEWEDMFAQVLAEALFHRRSDMDTTELEILHDVLYFTNNLEQIDQITFSHLVAIHSLDNHHISEFNQNMRALFANSHYQPYLDSYEKSQSFVLYLLQTYGPEMYIQVHFNLGNFEYIYGIAITEMTERWKSFLDELLVEISLELLP